VRRRRRRGEPLPRAARRLTPSVPPQSEDAPLVPDGEARLLAVERSSRDFLEVRRAEYVGRRERVRREGELLFTPSARTGEPRLRQADGVLARSFCSSACLRSAPTSVKLPKNTQPRYLEDEGLYVGERPPVSPANQNILENRFLKMEEVTPSMTPHLID